MRRRQIGDYVVIVHSTLAHAHKHRDDCYCDGTYSYCPTGKTWRVWPWRDLVKAVQKAVEYALRMTEARKEGERQEAIADEMAEEMLELVSN